MISKELKETFTYNRERITSITKAEYPKLYLRLFTSKGGLKKITLLYFNILKLIEEEQIHEAKRQETKERFLLSTSVIQEWSSEYINNAKDANRLFHYLCHLGFLTAYTGHKGHHRNNVHFFKSNRVSTPILSDELLKEAEKRAYIAPSKTTYLSLSVSNEDTYHYYGMRCSKDYLNKLVQMKKTDCEKIEKRLIHKIKQKEFPYLTQKEIYSVIRAYFEREKYKRYKNEWVDEKNTTNFIQSYLRPYLLSSNKLTYTRYPTKEQKEQFHLKDRKKAIYTLCVDDKQK